MPAGLVGRRAAHSDLGGIQQADLPAGAQMGEHVGQGAQPDPAGDGAAALGQQRADLSDCAGDRRAGDPEPAGQHVVGDPVAQVHQGGQQPVEEHQPMPSTRSDRPLARPVAQPCVLARLPARA